MDSTRLRANRKRKRAAGFAARASAALLATAALLSACSSSPARDADARLRRVELLALLQTLNADLLSHDSATLTLERWCADHRLGGNPPSVPARIVARRVHAAEKTIPADLRERLAIGAGEPLRYRRVQLVCGTRVLSEADNWYVPSRLTPAMNRLLETTDEPFGKVVRALDFRRHTLSAQLLWSPLPQDGLQLGNAAGGASFEPPYEILQHRAILETPERVPFSALIETYTRETIAGLR